MAAGVSENVKKCRGFCCIAFFALCAFPAVLKFGGAFFIDLRYQTIVPAREFSAAAVIASAGAALLGIALEWELLRRAKVAGRDFFVADLPLAGLAAMWFLPPLFPLLILCIALAAWSHAPKGSAFSSRSKSALWMLCPVSGRAGSAVPR